MRVNFRNFHTVLTSLCGNYTISLLPFLQRFHEIYVFAKLGIIVRIRFPEIFFIRVNVCFFPLIAAVEIAGFYCHDFVLASFREQVSQKIHISLLLLNEQTLS